MPVSSYNLHSYIAKRVNAELIEKLPGVDFYFENQETPPQKPDAWVRVSIRDGQSEQITIGCSSTTFRTVGVVFFQVFTKIEIGSREGLEIADIIASKFRAITIDGVLYRTPSINTLPRQADVFQITVSCPFQMDQVE